MKNCRKKSKIDILSVFNMVPWKKLDNRTLSLLLCPQANSSAYDFLSPFFPRHIYVYHDDPEVITNWYMAIRCAKLHRLQVAYPSASETDLLGYLTEDFAKEGWVWKTGPRSNDGYKKRWFTLDNRKLMYHDEPLDAYPKGEIFIGNKIEIQHAYCSNDDRMGWNSVLR